MQIESSDQNFDEEALKRFNTNSALRIIKVLEEKFTHTLTLEEYSQFKNLCATLLNPTGNFLYQPEFRTTLCEIEQFQKKLENQITRHHTTTQIKCSAISKYKSHKKQTRLYVQYKKKSALRLASLEKKAIVTLSKMKRSSSTIKVPDAHHDRYWHHLKDRNTMRTNLLFLSDTVKFHASHG